MEPWTHLFLWIFTSVMSVIDVLSASFTFRTYFTVGRFFVIQIKQGYFLKDKLRFHNLGCATLFNIAFSLSATILIPVWALQPSSLHLPHHRYFEEFSNLIATFNCGRNSPYFATMVDKLAGGTSTILATVFL